MFLLIQIVIYKVLGRKIKLYYPVFSLHIITTRGGYHVQTKF